MRPRAVWALLVAVLWLAAACGSQASPPPTPPGGGSASATKGSDTTAVPGGPATSTGAKAATTSVPVVVCPTSFGVTPTSTGAPPPGPREIRLPAQVRDRVAVYADQADRMELLGPRGWRCSALYGADGSGGVAVYPPGQPVPDAAPFRRSTAEAVVGSETAACVGCREVQACPLFAAAAGDYQRDFGAPCPETRPTTESVQRLAPGVVGFEDPPGVAGDGNPSGGPDPANGVMTYHAASTDGSWLDTCTLPSSDHVLCTAALALFVADYGSR